MAQGRDGVERWRGRPLRAGLVRLAVFAVPVLASVTVAALVSRSLSPATGPGSLATRLLAVLVPATLTLLAVDRVARRFLPLATLLRLSLVFPDRAPSRYAVARLVKSTQELQRRVEAARAGTIPEAPGEAARTILALVAALSDHDRRTRGHSERVRIYTDLLAEEMGLPAAARDRLRWAALVHDTGKLHVPERILNKAGRPTEDEWDVLRRHPEEGARLCGSLVPWLGEAGRAIVEHHERFDGNGYPAGLSGNSISLAGRILAVADAFEVMTAARAYKRAMSAADAREELARCAGTQFDPVVVRAFLSISLGRLRLAMGPLSWLAQWPFLSHLPQFGQSAGQAGAALGGAATLGAAGMFTPAGLGLPPPPTATAEVVAAQPAGDATPDPPPPVRATGGSRPAPDRAATPEPSPTLEPPPADVSAEPEPEPTRDSAPAPAPRARPQPTAAPTDSAPAPRPTREPDGTATPTPGDDPGGGDEQDGGDGDLLDDPVPVVEDTVEELADTVEDLADTVEDLADTVADEVTDPIEDTAGDLEEELDGAVDTVEDTVENLGGGLWP